LLVTNNMKKNNKYSAYDQLPYPLSKKHREAIYEAFGGRCFYTGTPISPDDAHVDHYLPKSRGGEHCASNLVLCRKDINLSKHATVIDVLPHTQELLLKVYAPKILRKLSTGSADRLFKQRSARRVIAAELAAKKRTAEKAAKVAARKLAAEIKADAAVCRAARKVFNAEAKKLGIKAYRGDALWAAEKKLEDMRNQEKTQEV